MRGSVGIAAMLQTKAYGTRETSEELPRLSLAMSAASTPYVEAAVPGWQALPPLTAVCEENTPHG
jgi:hypothetical protein